MLFKNFQIPLRSNMTVNDRIVLWVAGNLRGPFSIQPSAGFLD